ncbi:unnamed protein product [Prunus armeniaca]
MGNSSTDDSATTGDAPPLNSSVYSEGEMILAYDAKDTVSLENLVMSQIPSILRKQVVDDPEFFYQQDKDLLGMDTGSSSQVNESNRKGSRRVWTKEEEDALLDILEELVAKGHRANRTFRAGTLIVIENSLRVLCPGSGLKANPHIESKIKKLKKQFTIVYDMVNKTGFGWNDVRKCVKVDSEETWKAYLQHHKEAYGWRGKHFPLYDRLRRIFKVDHANVKTSQTPAEKIEVINCDEVNATEFGIEEDTCPRSVDQNSTTKQTDQLHSSQGKRRRQDDSGGSSEIHETNRKGSRRVWTKEEEDALLGILEDLVAKGYRENGTFKSGTLTLIEKALCNLCPASELKANPHVESKMKKLKKQYRLIYDMINRSGFGWNDLKKCLEVDSEESWKSYVQDHKEADGWRDKYFPLYDRLVDIFGVGHATVKPYQTPVERVEVTNYDEEINCDDDINCEGEINCDEESTDVGTEEDAYSRPIDQISTNKQTDQSYSSPRNRRQRGGLSVALDEVPASFVEMIKASNEQTRVLRESLQPKGNEAGELYREVKPMGLSVTDRVKALRLLVANPFYAELFLTLDNEEKLEFVKQLIDESSKK